MDATARSLLKGYVLWYGMVGGAVVLAASLFLGSQVWVLGTRDVLFFTALFALVFAPVPFAVSDSGLESAGVGVAGGFDVTDPSSYRAGTDRPLRYKVAFALAGAGAFAAVGFLVTGAL